MIHLRAAQMKLLLIIALFLAYISFVEAGPWTRLIFNNSNCDGEYIGFNYDPDSNQLCDIGSPCTELGAGFWKKEDCSTSTIPNYDGYIVVTIYTSSACNTVSSYFGGLPDTCFVYDNRVGILAYKFASCVNNAFSLRTHSDASCTPASLELSESVVSTCAMLGETNSYGKTYNCVPNTPVAVTPVAGPSAAPASAPSANSPTTAPITAPIIPPIAAPVASTQPVASPVKKSTTSGASSAIGSTFLLGVALMAF